MSAQKVYTERSRNGFTLIELLIVISIIAVLAVIGLVSYTVFLQNARNAKRQSDLKFIQSALEEYHADQYVYPGEPLGDSITNDTDPPTKTYMTKIPQESNSAKPYVYKCLNDCKSYCLYAKIEGTDVHDDVHDIDSACTSTAPAEYTLGITRP